MKNKNIIRQYVTLRSSLGEYQTHYRTKGEGMVVILLHPSPLSSVFMEPLISSVSLLGKVVAPDTPGYGDSDLLPCSTLSLQGYVEWLDNFLEALNINDAVFYGSATGAQIAIEYSKRYPKKICHLILDNVAIFNDSERSLILSKYFPNIVKKVDGSHLLEVWGMINKLFIGFPWYNVNLKDKKTLPLASIQSAVLDYLRLRDVDFNAYRAAFDNEKKESLEALCVPTTFIRWKHSLLKQYNDRLDDVNLPCCCNMLFINGEYDERIAMIGKLIQRVMR